MSRRRGAEGFESNKKARKQSKNDLKRGLNVRAVRQSIILACEGTKTECLYLKDIFLDLKKNHNIASSSLVIAKHKHTDPKGVLSDLLDYPNYQDFLHKWIVIDRDQERTNGGGHTLDNFNCALDKAKTKGVEVAYSNPCFEIWYLLHLEYRNTAIDRGSLQRKLKLDFGYQKNELFKQGSRDFAVNNAKRLLESHPYSDPANDNPSTTVHKLVMLFDGFKQPVIS